MLSVCLSQTSPKSSAPTDSLPAELLEKSWLLSWPNGAPLLRPSFPTHSCFAPSEGNRSRLLPAPHAGFVSSSNQLDALTQELSDCRAI